MSPLRMGFKHLGDSDFIENKGECFASITWQLLGMVGRVGMFGILNFFTDEDFLTKILGGERAWISLSELVSVEFTDFLCLEGKILR